MNSQWNDLIRQHYPDPDSVPGFAECALSALGDLGLIRVTGSDARAFLQGQLTCNLDEVNSQQSRLGAYCTPKGRALALFMVFEHAGDLYLQLPLERLEPVLKRLSMFVLRSDVSLTQVTDSPVCMGISGRCVAEFFPQLPAEYHAEPQDRMTIIRMPGTTERVLVVADGEQAGDWLTRHAQRMTLVNDDFWHLMDIRAGAANVYENTTEAFVPQMLNLQLLNGISFTKGCYTGQEVVARMKYLGQLKRRMYQAGFSSTSAPRIGDELYSASSSSGQGAGKIVDVRTTPEGYYEALVVAQIASVDADDLHLGSADGPKLRLSEPPYGFADD